MHKDCKVIFEKISAYLDGELDDETCEEIKHHLKGCPECLKRFGSLKKTVELCKDFPKEEVSEEIRQRLRDALKIQLKQDPV